MHHIWNQAKRRKSRDEIRKLSEEIKKKNDDLAKLQNELKLLKLKRSQLVAMQNSVMDD